MWVAHFFSKNIRLYAIFNDQSFNNMLNNGIVSFEQLDPAMYFFILQWIFLMCNTSWMGLSKDLLKETDIFIKGTVNGMQNCCALWGK